MTVLADRLTAAVAGLRRPGRISDADLDATLRQIRLALLEADVALPVARAFLDAVRTRARGAGVHSALNAGQQVIKIVNEELAAALGGGTRTLDLGRGRPGVIVLAGLQGAGKTSFAGKLGRHLARDGKRPLLVAADLFRPGAVAQLSTVAAQAGVAAFTPAEGNGEGDPVDVARRGVAFAATHGYDVVIVDTAGRVTVDEALMNQASEIVQVADADEVLLVVDAMGGQDVASTAAGFATALPVTGVVLTKCDGDSRGGAALTIRHVVGAPIVFAATGEKVDELEVFHPDRHSSRILGMGDMLTLIETAERAFDADHTDRLADAVATGELTFDDLLTQMQALRRLGPLTRLAGLLPGGGTLTAAIDSLDESDVARVEAIVCAMTPAERANPDLIDASRAVRIARGAGVPVGAVDALVAQLYSSRETLRQLTGGRPLPRLGKGRPGGRPARKPKSKSRKRR